MISNARINKIEEKIAKVENAEQEKSYKYVFSTLADLEEAEKKGLVNRKNKLHIIVLDE
ncbi:MAG: hypothetical protein ABH880_02095 [Patescibacteria group bacterium]